MTITINNLTKSYGDGDGVLKIIDNLSQRFHENRSMAIVGQSGIGKSTLMQLLGGLDAPDSGSIVFTVDDKDVDIAGLPSHELARFRGSYIGFIFQFHQLLPEFTAIENVAMPLIIAGKSKGYAVEKARALLDRVGLNHREEHTPGMLSGGEQQRVAIARALVASPQVVLADEPTGNLDETTGGRIQELLLEVTQELKALLIVVTHNKSLAAALDEVYEMNSGGSLAMKNQGMNLDAGSI